MHRLKRNEALLGKHKHGAINSFPQTAFAKQQPRSFLQLRRKIWGVYSEKGGRFNTRKLCSWETDWALVLKQKRILIEGKIVFVWLLLWEFKPTQIQQQLKLPLVLTDRRPFSLIARFVTTINPTTTLVR